MSIVSVQLGNSTCNCNCHGTLRSISCLCACNFNSHGTTRYRVNTFTNSLEVNPNTWSNISNAIKLIPSIASVKELREAIEYLENEIQLREKEFHNEERTSAP